MLSAGISPRTDVVYLALQFPLMAEGPTYSTEIKHSPQGCRLGSNQIGDIEHRARAQHDEGDHRQGESMTPVDGSPQGIAGAARQLFRISSWSRL
jgi:hypothetical protein